MISRASSVRAAPYGKEPHMDAPQKTPLRDDDALAPARAPGLALFDFDGTITTRDTFLHFALRTFGAGELARVVPALASVVGWSTGLIDTQHAKEAVTTRLFGGLTVHDLEARGRRFASRHLRGLVRAGALERLSWHRRNGHEIVVVTASFRYWIEPWCALYGTGLICTKLDEEGGVVSGRFDGPNCNGEEKARRIRERHDLSRYEKIYAYGNTKGDQAMLDLAHEGHMRPF